MANKNTARIEKANLMDARWINTPFAFVRVGKDFSLLQQQIMLKVSEHLQEYLAKFYRDKRYLSPDDPLSLFDDQRMPDIPVLKIPYKDFNVDVNNRSDLYDAIEDVMNVRIRAMVIKDGEPLMAWVNVFKQMTTSVKDITDIEYRNGTFDLKINETVAAYAFNMRLGYINHPAEIAVESTKVYAPKLYFIIKHKMRRGKNKLTIPYEELRYELGLNKEDKTQSDIVIIERLYPQFAKFKRYVLDAACEDINRMSRLNLLDINVKYKVDYPSGVERGNPDSITFEVSLSRLGEFHKDPKQAIKHMEITENDAPVQKRKRGRPSTKDKNAKVEDSVQAEIIFDAPDIDLSSEWSSLVKEYGDGISSEILKNVTYIGTKDGGFLVEAQDPYYTQMASALTRDDKLKVLLEKYLPNQHRMFRCKVSRKQ